MEKYISFGNRFHSPRRAECDYMMLYILYMNISKDVRLFHNFRLIPNGVSSVLWPGRSSSLAAADALARASHGAREYTIDIYFVGNRLCAGASPLLLL